MSNFVSLCLSLSDTGIRSWICAPLIIFILYIWFMLMSLLLLFIVCESRIAMFLLMWRLCFSMLYKYKYNTKPPHPTYDSNPYTWPPLWLSWMQQVQHPEDKKDSCQCVTVCPISGRRSDNNNICVFNSFQVFILLVLSVDVVLRYFAWIKTAVPPVEKRNYR